MYPISNNSFNLKAYLDILSSMMNKMVFFFFVSTLVTMTNADLTAWEMQKRMGPIGINLGNTLDAPEEGNWAPRAEKRFFVEYREKNFTNVRVPVRSWSE